MRTTFVQLAGYFRVPGLRRGLILFVAACAALALVHTQGLTPARNELAQLKFDAIGLQTRLDDAATRTALQGDFDRLSAELTTLNARFTASVERSELVERIAAMSARSGTRIIHGSNSFGTQQNGIVPVLQDLTVEGSYPQLRAFIGELADIETLTLPRSVEFSANAEGTLVRAKFRLVTYAGESR